MGQLINAVTPLADARAVLAEHFDLKYSPAVERETAEAYERVKNRIPGVEWPFFAPLIVEINRLKRQKNAAILAHNFQSPQIFHGVADVTGDSLTLALAAAELPQTVLVQAGVHFMAETTKVLNPGRTVLIPDSRAGCSLAGSITARDVRAMKATYPGVPVVAYMSSPAEVKVEADVCCTAGNALAVIEAMAGDAVILVPDEFLARNIARRTKKRVIAWAGACEVHETFSAADIAELRAAYPAAKILAHPECPPEVVAAVDYSGSSDALVEWVKAEKPSRVVMVTECSISDNVAAETEGTEFVRGCNICPHMKRITLENILWSLHTLTEEVTVAPEVIEPAAGAIRRMMEIERKHSLQSRAG